MRTRNAVGSREVISDLLRVIDELAISGSLDIQPITLKRSGQNQHGAGLVCLAYKDNDLRSWPWKSNPLNVELLGKLRIKMNQPLKDGARRAVIRGALSIMKTRGKQE